MRVWGWAGRLPGDGQNLLLAEEPVPLSTVWSWVIRRIFSTKDTGVEYPAKARVLSLWGPQGVDEEGVDHGSRMGATGKPDTLVR